MDYAADDTTNDHLANCMKHVFSVFVILSFEINQQTRLNGSAIQTIRKLGYCLYWKHFELIVRES